MGCRVDAASAIKEFIAELGVDDSVKQQLFGIEQFIDSGLVDLGPYAARMIIDNTSRAHIARTNCSMYDSKPDGATLDRSGALVFVKYFSDAFGVVRQPVVDFVGFGRDRESAWKKARRMPQIPTEGQGQFQREKSYMLWYQFKSLKIDSSKIEFPFYLSIVKQQER
ncbi:MAG: hypothetical protein RLY14_292 [Planctomycetota bacterium]|jgi:hypothetical protein